jgi:hypothetical protein
MKKGIEKSTEKMLKKTKKQLVELGVEPQKNIHEAYSILPKIQFEPKKINRFIVKFPKEFGIETYLVKSVSKPVLPVLVNINNIIRVELYDTITFNINPTLVDLVNTSKEFTLITEILDPTGKTIETWQLDGCRISLAEWSNLDYSLDTLSKILLTITYKNLQLK